MNEFILNSHDNFPLHCVCWDEVEKPKGILQISHGMAEHIYRYDSFAKFLNSRGYMVFGNDQRAHGQSVSDPSRIGMAVNDGDLFVDTVKDQIFISNYLKEKYDLPIFFLGHSYGSFIGQAYIQQCDIAKAVILMGSAYQKNALVGFATFVASLTQAFKGKDAPAKLIAELSFGQYGKLFENNMWLTRDKAEHDKYVADPLCGSIFSASFYKSFMKQSQNAYNKKSLENIRKDLPLLVVSGQDDPVGGQGKSTTKLYEMYKALGLKNAELKLYEGMRHEVLNELGRDLVYVDILNFLDKA